MDNSFLHRKRLLLVDDAPGLLNMVAGILHDAGFETLLTATTVKEAIITAKEEKPDLIVLDVMLPDGDGFSLMQQLRTFTDVPIIFLTAKDEAADKLSGLGLGADDYMVKPFLPEELLLRIYAVLRRTYKADSPLLFLEGCTVDLSRAEVYKGSAVIPLTAKEHTLLETLARNAGKIVTVDALCEALWGDNPFGYTKLTSNYYSIAALRLLPAFVLGMLGLDVLCLFFAYYVSKRRIIHNTEPIVSAVETLADGKPVSLQISGELSEIANSVSKASSILSRQNAARANWISGVSHDIRTPLSMIMGYAGRIAENRAASREIREQAEIVRKQSVKIKELVQDLNLVSQLEYEMQPLHKEPVRLSKLLRAYVADRLNTGIPDRYSIGIEIAPDAEQAVLECDARLISRAVNNLIQNSMEHNPQGCDICLSLTASKHQLILAVTDDGTGLSVEALQALQEKPHYMESTDERLDLRHGLGLLIVQQVTRVHHGTFSLSNVDPSGCRAIMTFSRSEA